MKAKVIGIILAVIVVVGVGIYALTRPQSNVPAKSSNTSTVNTPAASGNDIPQNNGGDHDGDNNGGPDDGDGPL